jgi:hypothetical protein
VTYALIADFAEAIVPAFVGCLTGRLSARSQTICHGNYALGMPMRVRRLGRQRRQSGRGAA